MADNKALTIWEQRNQYYKATDLNRQLETINKNSKSLLSSQLESVNRVVVSNERVREGIDAIGVGMERICHYI